MVVGADAGSHLPVDRTSFIGRRRVIQDLKEAITSARLVTVVGPGGVGKTRLAIHVARDLARNFRDGVWLVELAGLTDPELTSIFQ